ncbi:hypothetical protein PBCVCan184_624L [Paramecium bursaria Chlorella virus Can18-4]|nr:hypothetical protein PBCVCan184_624L [Paramecium bursaria Chlorella virus Can18-4]
MHYLLVALIVVAIVAASFWWIKVRKEKFTMKLYRPTYETKIPATTWDPASMLTEVMPQGKGKSPALAVELGNYRRFVRV